MTTFVLAVDHRNSLRKWLTQLGVPAADVRGRAFALKNACAGALEKAQTQLQPGEDAMLLIDQEYGVEAIPYAREHGLRFVVPAERSGLPEFEFEHGENFATAIDELNPYAVKALVRYNPDGEQDVNRRSCERLVTLQQHLENGGRRFMLELLVPPTERQAGADAYDTELRPALTCRAITELGNAGLYPDWWKLEGNRSREAAAEVARATAPHVKAGALVLGRGEDREKVIDWVTTAASTPGYEGFAVGRTLWTDPFARWIRGELREQDVVSVIADTYLDIAVRYRGAQHTRKGDRTAVGADHPDGHKLGKEGR